MSKGKKQKKQDQPAPNSPYFISIMYQPGEGIFVDSTLSRWELDAILSRIIERQLVDEDNE